MQHKTFKMKSIYLTIAIFMATALTFWGETKAAGDNNIYSALEGSGNFSTFLSIVKTAGMEETLKGEGSYTLFAPNDEAFASADPTTLEGLTSDQAQAQSFVNNLLLNEKLTSEDMKESASISTYSGASLSISAGDGYVMVGGAEVVQSDLEADNGIIHVTGSLPQLGSSGY